MHIYYWKYIITSWNFPSFSEITIMIIIVFILQVQRVVLSMVSE